MKRIVAALLACASLGAHAGVVTINENFDDLIASGWIIVNASNPAGTTSWFQGNAGVFAAQAGAPNAYAAANFLSTDPAGGTISTWLISPEIDFALQSVSFWARAASSDFDDALALMISTNGASTALGDFNVLLDINPVNATGGFPTDWTEFFAALGGVGSGRIAFQYHAGPNNVADYIGVDTVQVTPRTTVPEPAPVGLIGIALAALIWTRARAAAVRSAAG